ncbi:hypothetical protein [Chitinophaga sp. YIM B06452]|uniref:hypothetical protein n=1 Tax=Chitinophaga sp. YIM B06452 TaxID=3082158 RepID=UPI0031FE7812
MYAPLKVIDHYFMRLPDEVRRELAASVAPLHPDCQVRAAFSDETAENYLHAYMNEEHLTYNSEISRTLVMIGLIDYGMYGKNSSMYWKQLGRIMARADFGLETSEHSDNKKAVMRSTFNMRRRSWLEGWREWKKLKEGPLSLKAIADFEQDALINVIKRGDTGLYEKDVDFDGIMSLLFSKPDAFTSYLLMQRYVTSPQRNELPFFLGAPFSRQLLAVRRNP